MVCNPFNKSIDHDLQKKKKKSFGEISPAEKVKHK